MTDFVACKSHNLVPDFDHGLIDCFRVASHFKGAVLLNVGKTAQHLLTGDSHLVEHEPAVVLGLVAELGAEISDLDTTEGHVLLVVSNLHKEAINTIIVSIDNATSKYSSVVCPVTKTTRPVFGAGDGWRVDDPLISLEVERCSRLESSNVGAVAELSLGVATRFAHGSNVSEPERVLLITTKFLNSSLEHAVVQCGRINTSRQVLRHGEARLNSVVDLGVDVHHFIDEAPLPLLLLLTGHFDEVFGGNHFFGVLLHNFDQGREVLSVARQVNDMLHLLLIEVALVAFLLEIGVNYLALD